MNLFNVHLLNFFVILGITEEKWNVAAEIIYNIIRYDIRASQVAQW